MNFKYLGPDLEQLKQACSATMQDVLTLPVTLSEQRGARNPLEIYLAFSMYAIMRTGVELNKTTIANAYAAFRERHELPRDSSQKDLFSKHPVWPAALWKCAGLVVEEGSQQF